MGMANNLMDGIQGIGRLARIRHNGQGGFVIFIFIFAVISIVVLSSLWLLVC